MNLSSIKKKLDNSESASQFKKYLDYKCQSSFLFNLRNSLPFRLKRTIVLPIVILIIIKNKLVSKVSFLRLSQQLPIKSQILLNTLTSKTFSKSDLTKNYKKLSNKYLQSSQDELISIIMPTWNRKEVIFKSIQSVLQQSYQNFELIISDDGSTDGTLNFIKGKFTNEINSGKIKLISNNHSGVSKSRNLGIERSLGTYIAYLDSDNQWDKHYLLIMVHSLMGSSHDCAYSGINNRNLSKGDYTVTFEANFDYDQLSISNYIDLNAFIHKKELISLHKAFDEDLTRLVDWDLILRYTLNNTPLVVPISAVSYQLNDGLNNISNTENFEDNYNKVKSKITNQKWFLDQSPNFTTSEKRSRIAFVLWQYPTLSETFVRKEIELLHSKYWIKFYYYEFADSSVLFENNAIQNEHITSPEELADKLIADQITIIHSHFAYPTVTKLTWPAAEKAQIPFTYLSHGVDIFHNNNIQRNKWSEITQSKFCLKTYALGSFHHQFMLNEGAEPQKIVTRPQFINTNEFEFNFTQPSNQLKVCAIGRFIEKKGIEDLIKAASKLYQHQFNIYGFGELKENYLGLIDQLKLSNVFIHDKLDSTKEVNQVLSEHDLFILPCKRAENGDMDGIPTVLVEAMLTGTAVISSEISSIPDLIKNGVNGYLASPHSPQDLISKIREYYYLSPTEKAQLAKRAKNKALEMYDSNSLLSKYTRIWFNQPIDIFIVSYENIQELKVVINRVFKYTTCYFNLTIVDNNSCAKVTDYLKQLEASSTNINIQLLDTNVMCGPASNIALEKCKSDYIIYLCSKEGFVMNYNWEWDMINFMDANDSVGIAGNTNSSPKYSTFKELSNLEIFSKFRSQEYASSKLNDNFHFIQGGIYILRKSMYDEIGGFNPLTPHNHMDVEYSYYAQSQNWEIASISGVTSLSIKTRPNLEAYISENSKALHPMTILGSRNYDDIIKNKYKHCSVCDWIGLKFHHDNCPSCESTPEERLLVKYFSKNTNTFKSLKLRIDSKLDQKLKGIHKMFSCEFMPSILDNSEVIKYKYLIESPESSIHRLNTQQLKELKHNLSSKQLLFIGTYSSLENSISFLKKYSFNYNLIEYPEEVNGLTSYIIIEVIADN